MRWFESQVAFARGHGPQADSVHESITKVVPEGAIILFYQTLFDTST